MCGKSGYEPRLKLQAHPTKALQKMKLEQSILPDLKHGICKRKNWTKEKSKRNERKKRGWFWSLHDNHVLYPVLYTPTSLPMIPRPGTQALVVSRADKIVILALFASSLVRNNILRAGTESRHELLVN